MATNNPILFDAVLSAAVGGSTERWIQSDEPGAYAELADSAEVLALAVDALIPTVTDGATQQQANALQSIVQGVIANRYLVSTTSEDFNVIAAAIAAAFEAVNLKLEEPPPEPPAAAIIVTTASFVQPAKYTGTVSVEVSATEGLTVGDPIQINDNLYSLSSIDDATHITLKNTGVDANVAPAVVVPSASVVSVAHGTNWVMAFYAAGTTAAVLPICASPSIQMDFRFATGGGGGGGGGGPGFNATTTGGGGSGGRGGGGAGPAATLKNAYTASPGETLTIVVGAKGTGGTGGGAGLPGNPGNPATRTNVTGSISGLFCDSPTTNLGFMVGGGGPAGLTGAVTAGGASPAIGAGVNGQGTIGAGLASAASASGAGGTATAGANGATVNTQGDLFFFRPCINGFISGATGNAGGTGNAVNRGGGGAGSAGGGGGIGDMIPVNGVTTQSSDGVGGTPGHGGAADTNAGLTAGSNGGNGVNGQGGAGGGGGGGGGSKVGSVQAGHSGGNGGSGSDGLVIIYGFML